MICAHCNTDTVQWTGSILAPTGIRCTACGWSASGPAPEPAQNEEPDEGGPCPHCRTIGLEWRQDEEMGGCSCHRGHAPCGYCLSAHLYCSECGWEGERP
ncbi:hypothetical protein GGR16_002362 [Chelatococcus caeni]|uniref:Uncharacterized protein n=1 Tax=Chelatococcus caeni TaxID=1348468 RepID=A0A840BXR2_9HYPH|nr:hypothetical protein [Chelatococcus caeni]